MTFIDLFHGIGGFRLGFEQAGHTCVGGIEIDHHARRSYEAMYDTEGEFYASDIRAVDPADLPCADIYTAGFPCQTFSMAGRRRGFDDTRGTLIFEVLRLARERKPCLLVLENVKGLLSHDSGRAFETILAALDECGYNAEWQVFDGAAYLPQNRERIFIVGFLRGRCTGGILPIAQNDGAVDELQGYDANTLRSRYDIGTFIGKREQLSQVKQIGTRTDYGGTPRNQDRVYDIQGIAPTLPASRGGQTAGAHTPSVAIPCEGVYTNVSPNYNPGGLPNLSRTLKGGANPLGVYDGYRIRKLTPREYFRLQGFCGAPPFDDTLFERAEEVNSKTQLYKQGGNSVMVPVARAIGERIREI